jgi:hypothetical protein
MISLKQEMRELFNMRNGNYSFDNDPLQEEGLLQKILNLAFLNFHLYDTHIWNVFAIKSQVNLQKLYRIVKDPITASASAALLVTSTVEDPAEEAHAVNLLSLSLRYAAKYYFIDFKNMKEFDGTAIAREFAVAGSNGVSAVFCLGRFGSGTGPLFLERNAMFSDIFREI